MNTHSRLPGYLAAFALLGLAACSAPPAASLPPAQTDDSQMTPAADPTPSPLTVPAGKPFAYHTTLEGNPGADWKITLVSLRCGLTTLHATDLNPKYDGGTEYPQFVDSKAKPGSAFCRADWTWKNVGKTPGQVVEAGDVMIGAERYAKQGYDDSRSTQLSEQVGSVQGDWVNPHGTARSVDVWTVPAGSVATAIWFPMADVVTDSTVLVTSAQR